MYIVDECTTLGCFAAAMTLCGHGKGWSLHGLCSVGVQWGRWPCCTQVSHMLYFTLTIIDAEAEW